MIIVTIALCIAGAFAGWKIEKPIPAGLLTTVAFVVVGYVTDGAHHGTLSATYGFTKGILIPSVVAGAVACVAALVRKSRN